MIGKVYANQLKANQIIKIDKNKKTLEKIEKSSSLSSKKKLIH